MTPRRSLTMMAVSLVTVNILWTWQYNKMKASAVIPVIKIEGNSSDDKIELNRDPENFHVSPTWIALRCKAGEFIIETASEGIETVAIPLNIRNVQALPCIFSLEHYLDNQPPIPGF